MVENSLAFELITDGNRCFGAWVLRGGRLEKILSKITFVAAGGCGRVYYHSTNPRIATGGGIAMGFRAGAEIRNMEFIQFHPTSVYGREIDGRKLLVSETVRGEGGLLRTHDGKAFMEGYDPRGCLAARDIVARAIDSELKKSGDEFVWLDLSPIGSARVIERFPQIHADCLSVGIDVTKQPIPVVPAAHYVCGGIGVDLRGRTSVDRLYAAGEVACTGVHGANRLASNSLLEALVFSEMSARDASGRVREDVTFPDVEELHREEETVGRETLERLSLKLRKLMWDCVGIVRYDDRLVSARRSIAKLDHEIEDLYRRHRITVDSVELRSMVTVAELITRSALMRKESRGLHYNPDHPHRDDTHFCRDTVVRGP
jgi:L-aspartate oxidase